MITYVLFACKKDDADWQEQVITETIVKTDLEAAKKWAEYREQRSVVAKQRVADIKNNYELLTSIPDVKSFRFIKIGDAGNKIYQLDKAGSCYKIRSVPYADKSDIEGLDYAKRKTMRADQLPVLQKWIDEKCAYAVTE